MMFDFDDKEIQRLEKELRSVAARAFPFATKSALNTIAFKTRSISQDRLRDKFVLRNKWTVGSIRVEQARTLDIDRQAATVGSTEPYLEKQEFGFRERRKGKYGVAIPTSWSAGQEGTKPRTRLPRPRNRLKAIQLAGRKFRNLGRSPKQRIVVAIYQAVSSGRRFTFLTMPDEQTHGIFRVLGGRVSKGRVRGKTKLKMVHDLSRDQISGKPRPWLDPSVEDALPKLGEIYEKALKYQLDRLGLL